LSNVTVYNFGIDGAVVADELALLRRFRKVYDIDQVIFLTGANDVMFTYMSVANPSMSVANPSESFAGLINAFELLKFVGRLKALQASSGLLEKLDNELLPSVVQRNSLLDGLISADEYCRISALRCDFVLQPVLLTRKALTGPEIRIARTLRQVWPRYDELFTTMYRTSLSAGLTAQDSSDVFDQLAESYFIDAVHLNEAGYRHLAARIMEIAARRIPTDVDRAH
jgi:GDSL-like Lipase/Acylhydrolase